MGLDQQKPPVTAYFYRSAICWITRAQAARRLGVSAIAVTKFCRKGMPFRLSDGNVCWPDALYWSGWYHCPLASGNWRPAT